MSAQVEIPSAFSPFFWDVHVHELDKDRHRIFIIERLLNEGDQHTLRWLLEVYTDGELRQAVMTARGLNRKATRYWQHYFGLREEEMRCFGTFSTWLHYPFPVIRDCVKAVDMPGFQAASLIDIALMKLVAVSQRGARKDFIDLYAIAQHDISLVRDKQACPVDFMLKQRQCRALASRICGKFHGVHFGFSAPMVRIRRTPVHLQQAHQFRHSHGGQER